MSILVKKTFSSFLIFFMVLVLGRNVHAQEVRASIGGRGMDSQGRPVTGVALSVINDHNNVQQETKPNGQGVWVAEFLLPGHYRFIIGAAGFKTQTRKGITLSANDVKQIDTD